ncbi:MAG: hypothetical protein HY233_06220 [Acidobacteriales bacterium]|nr:hypothetical protein [Terriglobales bacterium]
MRLTSQGFTLIATLLLLLLLSGIAIGLMMMVNTEGKVGGADLQNNVAYHNAEGAIENMTSDLSAMFKSVQSPQPGDICALSSKQPYIAGVTWKDYDVRPTTGCTAPLPKNNYGQIQSGPNKDLYAQIVPVTMLVTAAQTGGQEVSMMRTAQVALIPVFQFGVFSDSDVGFYASPNLNFAGRVHTNGDLYVGVANSAQLTFHDKLTAFGNVVRQNLPNGLASSSYNNTGTVLIPTASQGCDGAKPACRAIALTEGSVTGMGGKPPQSSQNASWPSISLSTYNSKIIDGNYGNTGGTGAKNLALPFVNGTTFPFEIIRRPQPTDSVGLSQSREYNLAQIHVLLADDPAEFPGGAQPTDVRLANVANPGPDYTRGVPVPIAGLPATRRTYFAEGSTVVGLFNRDTTGIAACLTNANQAAIPLDWPNQPAAAGANQTLVPIAPVAAPLLPPAGSGTWNLLDGYLRVEYRNTAGDWIPVTREWLELGFARGTTPPTLSGNNAPAVGTNPVHPNAILILQQPADRNANGTVNGMVGAQAADLAGAGCMNPTPAPRPAELQTDATTASVLYGDFSQASSVTRTNWYPINFYDAREGEPRDIKQIAPNTNSCTANGVMNAVEIDVGNLKQWLWGTAGFGAIGPNVDFAVQNGWVLYFSDRRGMLPNPNAANVKTGDSGLEDSINRATAAGAPDGVLDPIPAGKTLSPEDVNQSGLLDSFGAKNMGLGFYNTAAPNIGNINAAILAAAPDNPYSPRINTCSTTARKNWVSGARHGLKLVDGALGNVPVRKDLVTAAKPLIGGFTVASENPVYIQGNYNSDATDPIWAGGNDVISKHANAAVIADAVTILSNQWYDRISMTATPTVADTRPAATTYYRVAIAAGKNMNFPFPNWESGTNFGFGTDGGVHNFLRFLESWNGVNLNYEGSLVSLYYSTYNTGAFKCCTYAVYRPPVRNYVFDPDFATPEGLPPGTPAFKDVDTLGYRQLFAVRDK